MALTPCGVAYQCIGAFAGTKRYEEIDDRIISKTFLDSKGRSPYERIQTTKTYRTREIIQKDPHSLDPRTFADVYDAARDLISFFRKSKRTNGEICDYFSGEATQLMMQSLENFGYNPLVLRNTMDDIARCNEESVLDTAMATMMLFLSYAFYCDTRDAIPLFNRVTKHYGIGVNMQTGLLAEEGDEGANPSQGASYALLGLVRRYDDGRMGSQIYSLNPGPEGTLVGRMAPAEFCINDVDSSVSRSHLLIYRENDTWMAQGKGSTNGSKIERPGAGVIVIENGRGKSRRVVTMPPVAIQAGDTLVLGLGTRFEVVLLGHAE